MHWNFKMTLILKQKNYFTTTIKLKRSEYHLFKIHGLKLFTYLISTLCLNSFYFSYLINTLIKLTLISCFSQYQFLFHSITRIITNQAINLKYTMILFVYHTWPNIVINKVQILSGRTKKKLYRSQKKN